MNMTNITGLRFLIFNDAKLIRGFFCIDQVRVDSARGDDRNLSSEGDVASSEEAGACGTHGRRCSE